MIHFGAGRQVFGERCPLRLPPADRVGEPANGDGEKVDPRIDVLPDGHAPSFPARRDVGAGHAGTVEEFARRVLAAADGPHGVGNDAVEVAAIGGIPLGFRQWLQALEHEVGHEPHRSLEGFDGPFRGIVLVDNGAAATRVSHAIDEIPHPLPLHAKFGRGHIDIHEPRWLEGKLQAPDIPLELTVFGPLDEGRVGWGLLRLPRLILKAAGHLQQVAADRVGITAGTGRNHGEHAGGKLAEAFFLAGLLAGGSPVGRRCRRSMSAYHRHPGNSRAGQNAGDSPPHNCRVDGRMERVCPEYFHDVHGRLPQQKSTENWPREPKIKKIDANFANPLDCPICPKQNLAEVPSFLTTLLDQKIPLFPGILAYAAATFRKTLHQARA